MRNTDGPHTRANRMASILASLALLATTTVAATAPAGAVAAPPTAVRTPAAQINAGDWLDTTDRRAVIESHDAEFSRIAPAIEWTGDRSTCQPGTTSQAYRTAIIDRVNWFRSMAGVPADVIENATYSAKAQEAALMMSVSDRLSHSPDPSFGCYTGDGAQAAGSSNLYLGRTGPHAITGYMLDPGAGNVSVGHRNWILHPTVRQFGTGDTPGPGRQATNTLWVVDNAFGAQPQLRESEGFIAWPARGFVPGDLVFPRWSFSLRGADLASSTVTTQRIERGEVVETVDSPIVFRNDSAGAPFSIVVWEPVGIDTSPSVDTTYRVTVGDIGVGSQSRTISYEVTVIGDVPAPQASPSQIAAFADAAHQDFIGRDASTAEEAEWNRRLSAGETRFDLVSELTRSDEWAAKVVDDMYRDTLGRVSDSSGRAFWINRLRGGMSVARMAALFYGSPEYLAAEGNQVERWIGDLYDELLERRPDSGGLRYWVAQTGQSDPGSVALRFYQSDESRRSRVQALYGRLLGRGTDPAGEDHWAAVLVNGDDLALAANLAASDEYFDRAQAR